MMADQWPQPLSHVNAASAHNLPPVSLPMAPLVTAGLPNGYDLKYEAEKQQQQHLLSPYDMTYQPTYYPFPYTGY